VTVQTLSNSNDARIGSPIWWVNRLYERLQDRLTPINLFDDYYRGQFPLPWLAPQAADDFRRILKMSRTNPIGLVCDAQVERQRVEGFRINAETNPTVADAEADNFNQADSDTWRIWTENNLDAFFDQGLLEAAITGAEYLLVAPNPKNDRVPNVWVEHSSQCIIEYVPGSTRRDVAAGLKVWQDDWTGDLMATLYLPEGIYKYKAPGIDQRGMSLKPRWQRRGVQGESWPAANPLGIVPIFECPNNPRLLTGGRSEIEDLIDPMDRIVKTIADRLMTQDYGAFPQKWASGWPEADASGTPTAPIQVGRDRMITTEVVETKFGQFSAADVNVYVLAKADDVKDIASRSRTPAQYLLGEMSNVSGETLKASESGLVSKVLQRNRGQESGLKPAMRLARRLAGLATPGDAQIEVLWRNPEFRTEGELVSALVQMRTLGVPEEALWERWGATPGEIARWKAMREAELAAQAAADATALLADSFRTGARPANGSANGNGPNPRPGGAGVAAGRGARAGTGSTPR